MRRKELEWDWELMGVIHVLTAIRRLPCGAALGRAP